MNIDDILSRLKGVRKSSKGYLALCPAHDDRRPSLQITNSADRILIHCFTGCSPEEVTQAISLDMQDLFKRESASDFLARTKLSSVLANNREPSRVRAVKSYRYCDLDGSLLYENVRHEPKTFKQRRPDGNDGFIYNLSGVKRVPYLYPELNEVLKNSESEIWMFEGEKDCENVRAISDPNFIKEMGIAVTNFKNLKDWPSAVFEKMRTSKLTLFSDHDVPGLKLADEAVKLLSQYCERIKLVDLHDGEPMPDKSGKDVSDWIEFQRSLTSEEGFADDQIFYKLLKVVEDTPYQTQLRSRSEQITGLEIEYLDTIEAKEVEWLCSPLIPNGFFTLVDGIEGIGKTYVILDLAKRLTIGEAMPFKGEMHEPARVLFLSLEDSPEFVIKPRFERMGGDCSRFAILRGNFEFDDRGFEELEKTIEAEKYSLIIFDPLFSFTGRADINNTADVRSITDRLNKLAAKYEIAIVGIRHINKSKGFGEARSAGSHSVAWVQGCRSALIIGHDPDDKSERGVGQHKLNIAAESKSVFAFEIDADGILRWKGESDLTISTMLSQKTHDTNATRSALFEAMEFLRDSLADGRRPSTDLENEAKEVGISLSTLKRAKIALGVTAIKDGIPARWFWKLPDHGDSHSNKDDQGLLP